MNELISNEAVCRTAPATPGQSIMCDEANAVEKKMTLVNSLINTSFEQT